jgi:hypothetical protein
LASRQFIDKGVGGSTGSTGDITSETTGAIDIGELVTVSAGDMAGDRILETTGAIVTGGLVNVSAGNRIGATIGENNGESVPGLSDCVSDTSQIAFSTGLGVTGLAEVVVTEPTEAVSASATAISGLDMELPPVVPF